MSEPFQITLAILSVFVTKVNINGVDQEKCLLLAVFKSKMYYGTISL